MNIILFLGGLLGFSSVALGAYVDHVLALQLSAKEMHSLLTAVKFHQFYALVIVMIGLMYPQQENIHVKRWLIIAGGLFLIGTFLFSFGIYFSIFFNNKSFLHLAPFGGSVLMFGWLALARIGLFKMKQKIGAGFFKY